METGMARRKASVAKKNEMKVTICEDRCPFSQRGVYRRQS
jgi:hypothetical protein